MTEKNEQKCICFGYYLLHQTEISKHYILDKFNATIIFFTYIKVIQ